MFFFLYNINIRERKKMDIYCDGYANEFVFTLPKKTQDKIISVLNHYRTMEHHFRDKAYYAENDDTRKYCQEYQYKYENMQKTMCDTLAILDIHPVVDWAGHRDSYFFPTFNDCLMEEEFRRSCIE